MPRSQMKILTARLPAELYNKLQAVGGEGGMSAVVRQTLERGLAAEAPAASDVRTGVLLRFIAASAKAIEDAYDRPWHRDQALTRTMYDAVRQAVIALGRGWEFDENGNLLPDDWMEESAGDPEWRPPPPPPPKPGSTLDHLLLHPGLRFRELDTTLLASALWSLIEFDKIPAEPSSAPPFTLPPEPKE